MLPFTSRRTHTSAFIILGLQAVTIKGAMQMNVQTITFLVLGPVSTNINGYSQRDFMASTFLLLDERIAQELVLWRKGEPTILLYSGYKTMTILVEVIKKLHSPDIWSDLLCAVKNKQAVNITDYGDHLLQILILLVLLPTCP